MRKLYHYSDIDLTDVKLHSKEYYLHRMNSANDTHGGMKPVGFWVSVGAEWSKWCRGERFRVDTLKKKHEIVLKDDAKILLISSVFSLDLFTSQYVYTGEKSANLSSFSSRNMVIKNDKDALRAAYELRKTLELIANSKNEIDSNMAGFDMGTPFVYEIDWKKVTEEYQGIIISPYIWQRRLAPHTMWYYGWDVASGCIWDTDAIEEVKLVERRKKGAAV